MVCVKVAGHSRVILTGPLSSSGLASWGEGAEIVWIKFKVGVFMPHLLPRMLVDKETLLPAAGDHTFWLSGFSMPLPDFGNIEQFVARLDHEDLLRHDPLPAAVITGGDPNGMSSRTVRHRVLQSTGLAPNNLLQFTRAHRAAAQLAAGAQIADAVFDHGYVDQSHLTRSLNRWVGRAPGAIARANI